MNDFVEEKMTETNKKKKVLAGALYYGRVIITTLILIALLKFFLVPTIINGSSMENTLHNKDYVFVSAQSYKLLGGSPKRGDIIVFPVIEKGGTPIPGTGKKQENYIKRIIGIPGDTISIKKGKVYVNGKCKKENYIKDGITDGEIIGLKVPKNQVFILGDNRLDSEDSRVLGTVPQKLIKGKAILRIYPKPKIF